MLSHILVMTRIFKGEKEQIMMEFFFREGGEKEKRDFKYYSAAQKEKSCIVIFTLKMNQPF